ncbi:MAG: SRPBCC family protein [Acidimicrobiales bacterium]
MIRGEGTTIARGVSPEEAFDFVLDPAQYTKADTKMVWVTKVADTPDGMIAREDGKFMGRFKGSVITRYSWVRPTHIDVVLEHGVPEGLHAWFDIEEVEGGTRIRHVEEMQFGHGLLGKLYDLVARDWFAKSVRAEVTEIGRLLEAGERGRPDHLTKSGAERTP